jgi:SAM-dependent methyltransferase
MLNSKGDNSSRTSKEENGHVPHPQRVYLEQITRVLNRQMRWLDLGCGRQLVPWWLPGRAELEAEMKSSVQWLVGIDSDFDALRDNDSCQLRLKADGAVLPFADGVFDLVTSNMVFEHLEQPGEILFEIRRVLRPNGRLIVLTPNWLDIVTIVARLVPNRLHPAMVSHLEFRGKADVYPTHFRFNRPRTVDRLLHEAGFKDCSIEQLDHPDTYSHVPLIAPIESVWHGLARRWPSLRGTLLIVAEA